MSEEESVKILESGCLVCKERGPKSLFEKDGKTFVQCRECGLIYQDPPPLAEESQAYYEKNYYEEFGERVSLIRRARPPLYKNSSQNACKFLQWKSNFNWIQSHGVGDEREAPSRKIEVKQDANHY
jgi:hypothetical protein